MLGHPRDAMANALEGIEHDAGPNLLDPLSVEALLRHGPRVAHHDDWQTLLYGLADTARPGFADEEIAELHVVADLRGKTQHHTRRGRTHGAQLIGEHGIVAAHQNELHIIESLGDASHDARSMPPEHHDARRAVGVES